MTWVEILLLPLIGACGGFLAGMLGVGGGIIFIPILTYFFSKMGMDDAEMVKFTLANSTFLVFVSGISGVVRQKKTGTLNWKKILRIGIPGAITAGVLSAIIDHGIPCFSCIGNIGFSEMGSRWLSNKASWYEAEKFHLVFLLFLCLSIANMLLGKKDHEASPNGTENRNKMAELGVAILAGSVVSLSGLGGGVIMVPLFRMLLKMPMRSATALSLSIIPLLSIAPLITYFTSSPTSHFDGPHTGYIAWAYALPISVGVAIFAGIGLKVAQKIPVIYLRIIFAALSTVVLIKTLLEILDT